jgi:hypothetical protein
MSDYTGLDDNLISTSSPSIDQTTSYDVNSTFDRNSVGQYSVGTINASKVNAGTLGANVAFVGTITAGQIYGGTLTLGGTTNGNGVLVVNGTAGTSTIKIDNTGVSLISGTAIIDSVGLNSTNNFYADVATGGSFTTSSTTPASITGGTLSSIVLTRSTRFFVYVAINGLNTSFGEGGGGRSVAVCYDSYGAGTLDNFYTNYTGIESVHFDGGGHADSVVIYNQRAFTGKQLELVAGTHTLNLQTYTGNGSGTTSLIQWELGLIQLGS